MIIDGRQSDGLPETAYDLVIVGAGPAGISLARELDATGLRIALLESGGEDYDDAAQDLNEGTILGNDAYDLASSRLRFLGGTSNHWGGQCTPLDEIDFRRAPPGFTGWPFAKSELDPYYARAHDYCDVGAPRYDAAALAPEDPDLWLFRDRDEVKTAVLRQSAPTRFGEKYRAALAASETVHLWLWTTATGVSTRPAAAEGGEYVDTRALGGPARRFTAKAVVLAGGAIETTRLLLWSNVQNGTGAGAEGSLLGRCYMDHIASGVAFLHFADPVGEKIYWADLDAYADAGVGLHFGLRLSEDVLEETGLGNAFFALVPLVDDTEARQRRGRARGAEKSFRRLAKWMLGRDTGGPMSPHEEYCRIVAGADDWIAHRTAGLMSQSGPSTRRALLRFEAEERPSRDSGVALDDSRRDALGMPAPVLTWRPAQSDIQSVRDSAILLGQYAGAEGLGRVELEDKSGLDFAGVQTAWHQLGTTRMAVEARDGVVDQNCRVHGAGALYVASGSVFPTVGRANPTLTIVALSLRLADHLKQRMAS